MIQSGVAPVKTYVSQVFGLTIESRFNLGLRPGTGSSDLTLLTGSCPPNGSLVFEASPPHATCGRRTGETITLTWPSGTFAVTANQIVVDAADPVKAIDLFLQPCLAVALAARGTEVLHGCAVGDDGRAIAVLGDSGVGKTTAGLMLLDRGWQLISDDLLAFDQAGRCNPGPPYVRLSPDRATNRSGTFDAGGKFRYLPPSLSHPIPLTAIVVLADRYRQCRLLSGAEAFDALLSSCYLPLLGYPDQARRRFDLGVDLCQIPIYGSPPRSLTADLLDRLADGDLS